MFFFIPGTAADRRRALEESSLRGVFAGESGSVREVFSGGPGGGGGFLVGTPGRPPPPYRASSQRWSETNEGWWVGIPADEWNPDTIARPENYEGHRVKLGDGRSWLVPIARQFPSGCPLPHVLKLGPDGGLRRVPRTRFAQICEDAERVFYALRKQASGPDSGLSDEEAWPVACRALAVNYRVNPEIVSALELLDTASVLRVLEALIDLPTMQAWVIAEAKAVRDEASAEGNAESPTPPRSDTGDGSGA